MTERALSVRVEGLVQGVGFRAFTQQEARRLGVKGWVVNRDDGSVEAALYGAGAALGDLVGRLRQGPPGAKIEKLDVSSTDRGKTAALPSGAQAF